MATTSDKLAGSGSERNWTLHEMFHVVGDQLLPRDVRVLKFLYSGIFPESLSTKIKDGFTFFLALERIGRVDESNFKYINNALRMIVRHDLIPLVTLRKRKPVEPDPVDLYLQETSRKKKEKESCWKRKPPFFHHKSDKGHSAAGTSKPVSNNKSLPTDTKRSKGCLKRKGSSRLKGKNTPEVPEKKQATNVSSSPNVEQSASSENRTGLSKMRSATTNSSSQGAPGEVAVAEAQSYSSNEGSDSECVQSSLVHHTVSTSPRRPSNTVLSHTDSPSSSKSEARSSASDDRLKTKDSLKGEPSTRDSAGHLQTPGSKCNYPSSTSPQPSTSKCPSASSSSSCASSSSTFESFECSSSKSPKSSSSSTSLTGAQGESSHKKMCPEFRKPSTSLESAKQSPLQAHKQFTDSHGFSEPRRELVSDSPKNCSSRTSESPSASTSGDVPRPSTSSSSSLGSAVPVCVKASTSRSPSVIPKSKVCKSTQTPPEQQQRQQQSQTLQPEIRKKVTCDIRLRVRAEYCHHESALQGNVFSNKPELLERQFEKFMQANTILKSRDLGSIICDIKFSELTYLDAFWRDYINGSLLEALKGVFITESLKQAVGHEAIKLLVNVDEDDYEAGRQLLLQNLRD